MAHICKKLCLILLPLVHAIADDCLTAIFGEAVQIPCFLKTTESLKVDDISLEWTTSHKDDIVHAFQKGRDDLNHQEHQFKGRTHLFISELPRGNFSLMLSNVSVSDELQYVCSYSMGNKHNEQLSEHCLQTAGRYSDPIVYGLSPVLEDSDVNFICTSSGGFPEPKVYWLVNKKLLQDSRQVNTTLSRDSRGLYSVNSIFSLNVTDDVSVTCTVENEKLREKRTSAEIKYQIEKAELDNQTSLKIGLPLVLLLIAVIVGIVLWRRKKQKKKEWQSKDNVTQLPLQLEPN
ncbi:butyrophilin subfamily 3 member A1-like [Erpetoichthys calabaricus]|uniref:butyrophilin subfamily 3 member A1-like n=1 Tax=Erpetoichthys calabaricus TaxID=27687 RepID=UPI002233F29B|nr:butyrophilin subfamily 3 member A1-like [Erpetoichthys calabaricus]